MELGTLLKIPIIYKVIIIPFYTIHHLFWKVQKIINLQVETMGRVPSQQEPEVSGRGLPASPHSQTCLRNPPSPSPQTEPCSDWGHWLRSAEDRSLILRGLIWKDPWVRKISWRRKWLQIPIFLPGKSQGQKSLVGYSPWHCKESDMSERLNTKIAQELLPLQGRNRPPTAWQEGATLFLAR